MTTIGLLQSRMGFLNCIFKLKHNLSIHPRLLVTDFDGVMTDNKIFLTEDGKEAVVCNRSDGWGISLLRKQNFPIVVLSTESNPVVQARCNKLNIPCYQNSSDKLLTLKQLAAEHKVLLSEIVYVGNDTNDLDCIRAVGCGVAVKDSHPEIRKAAKIVLSSKGGEGAIREVCEIILKSIDERL